MSKARAQIEVSSVPDGEHVTVLFFDLDRRALLDDLTDYTIFLSRERLLDSKTIVNHSYHLRSFWIFALARCGTIANIRDSDLEAFRDESFKSVLSSARSRRTKKVAMATVNERLRRVYDWLTWLMVKGRAKASLIGSQGCRIRSALPLDNFWILHSGGSKTQSSLKDKDKHPLVYPNTGSASKHRTQYSPTDKVRFDAISYLHEQASSDYLAHRNTLLIDIANGTSWRRESMNSLTVRQLREAAARQSDSGYVALSPEIQKFDYTDVFDIPAWLVVRALHFVDNYLKPLASKRRWKVDPEQGKLFLSELGRPLTDRTITEIIGAALQAAGAPRWAAAHSLRRKFAREEIKDETRYRLKEGLDTTAASIATSVSLRLGQHSSESLYPYVSQSLTAGRLDSEPDYREHIASLEDEVRSLRKKLSESRNSPPEPTSDTSDVGVGRVPASGSSAPGVARRASSPRVVKPAKPAKK
jgi:site-specific recombinase XerC